MGGAAFALGTGCFHVPFGDLREGFRVVSEVVIMAIVMARWGNCHEGNSLMAWGGRLSQAGGAVYWGRIDEVWSCSQVAASGAPG